MNASLGDQVRTKQARLTELLAEAAALELELNEAFRLLSPTSGRPRVPLASRAVARPPLTAPAPPVSITAPGSAPNVPARTAVDESAVERLVRHALMTGPFATRNDAHELQTLEERCEDITGLAPGTVERVLENLLSRGLVKREDRLYRRAS